MLCCCSCNSSSQGGAGAPDTSVVGGASAPREHVDTTSAGGEGNASERLPSDTMLIDSSGGAIVELDSPTPGAVIDGGEITLRGRLRAFENGGNYLLLANGDTLVRGHFVATGEMGTLNPFTISIPVPAGESGKMFVEVLTHSPRDGGVLARVRCAIFRGARERGARKGTRVR